MWFTYFMFLLLMVRALLFIIICSMRVSYESFVIDARYWNEEIQLIGNTNFGWSQIIITNPLSRGVSVELAEITDLALLPPVPLSTEDETSQESNEVEEEEDKPRPPAHLFPYPLPLVVNDNNTDAWASIDETSSEENHAVASWESIEEPVSEESSEESEESSSSSLVFSMRPTVPFLSLRDINRRRRTITAIQEVQNIAARTIDQGHLLFQTRARGRGFVRGSHRGYGRVRRLQGRGRARGRGRGKGRGSRIVISFPLLFWATVIFTLLCLYITL